MLFVRPEHLGFLFAFAVGSALPGTLTAQTPACTSEEYRQLATGKAAGQTGSRRDLSAPSTRPSPP